MYVHALTGGTPMACLDQIQESDEHLLCGGERIKREVVNWNTKIVH